jgi:hypothetical protein
MSASLDPGAARSGITDIMEEFNKLPTGLGDPAACVRKKLLDRHSVCRGVQWLMA